MASTKKERDGIIYFPLKINLFDDPKILLVEEKFGELAGYFAVKLLSMIYANGYFLEYDHSMAPVLARRAARQFTSSKVIDIINYLCDIGLINRGMFENQKILTSLEIQELYRNTQKLYRKVPKIRNEHVLACSEQEKPAQKDPISVQKVVEIVQNSIGSVQNGHQIVQKDTISVQNDSEIVQKWGKNVQNGEKSAPEQKISKNGIVQKGGVSVQNGAEIVQKGYRIVQKGGVSVQNGAEIVQKLKKENLPYIYYYYYYYSNNKSIYNTVLSNNTSILYNKGKKTEKNLQKQKKYEILENFNKEKKSAEKIVQNEASIALPVQNQTDLVQENKKIAPPALSSDMYINYPEPVSRCLELFMQSDRFFQTRESASKLVFHPSDKSVQETYRRLTQWGEQFNLMLIDQGELDRQLTGATGWIAYFRNWLNYINWQKKVDITKSPSKDFRAPDYNDLKNKNSKNGTTQRTRSTAIIPDGDKDYGKL